jgi:hypothetical protein
VLQCTSVILAAQEVEIEKISLRLAEAKIYDSIKNKSLKHKRARGMAQVA